MRVGRRVFQRRALYLGELNDSQRAEWQRAVEALGDDGKVRQLKLIVSAKRSLILIDNWATSKCFQCENVASRQFQFPIWKVA